MTNKKEIYEKLVGITGENNVFIDEPMSKHTSFKIGGPADFLVKIDNTDKIKQVLDVCKKYELPIFVLGNGSNVLVKDKGIRGVVLKINIQGFKIQKEDAGRVKVIVGAGEKVMAVAQKLQKEAICGFEFASGIPGTIGGAIKMNAGAYGGEFKDIVLLVTYMDYEGNIKLLKNDELEFEYRNSIFSKQKAIILEVILGLKIGDKEDIKEKMDTYLQKRKLSQPIDLPNAGSTFKRGTDYITAQLIDECNLKGKRVGDAIVSKKHAGFIVNLGNATAKDVFELVEIIKQEVFKKFNKKIELEVEVIGE